MPKITDQERLLRENVLVLVSKGPKDGMWWGHYLKCPICGYYVSKGGGYDECPCGNIAIDNDMFRVSIEVTSDSVIECYKGAPNFSGGDSVFWVRGVIP